MAALIRLWVSSPETHSELRFSLGTTVTDLKSRLETITGIPAHSQALRLQRGVTVEDGQGHGGAGEGRGEKEVVAVLEDGSRTLGSYGAKEWMTLRVDNTDPLTRGNAGQFTDTSRVEKFELTPEEYQQRSDTVLAYKQRNQLGRFAPAASAPLPPPPPVQDDIVPGARCEVALSSELSRRGTIRFVGPTGFGPQDGSSWVGIQWDEPVGKNDGMVDGKRYFQTPPMYASFVKPDKVTVGDFPEIDPFADDMEM